jgi:Kef-type K+ transport system membrane component KefB
VIYQLGVAVAVGVLAGFGMRLLGKFAGERKEIVTLTFGVLFLTFSFAKVLGVDELLSTMIVGVSLVNISEDNRKFREPLEDYIEDILFTAFFVLGSSFLKLDTLYRYFPFVLLYVSARFLGKYAGAYLGGRLSGAPQKVNRHLALTLFPQGGIVIGLALLAFQSESLGGESSALVNVIIGATLVHELIGPLFSKLALVKAGEVNLRRL